MPLLYPNLWVVKMEKRLFEIETKTYKISFWVGYIWIALPVSLFIEKGYFCFNVLCFMLQFISRERL